MDAEKIDFRVSDIVKSDFVEFCIILRRAEDKKLFVSRDIIFLFFRFLWTSMPPPNVVRSIIIIVSWFAAGYNA